MTSRRMSSLVDDARDQRMAFLQIFDQLDRNGDGLLTLTEMQQSMRDFGFEPHEESVSFLLADCQVKHPAGFDAVNWLRILLELRSSQSKFSAQSRSLLEQLRASEQIERRPKSFTLATASPHAHYSAITAARPDPAQLRRQRVIGTGFDEVNTEEGRHDITVGLIDESDRSVTANELPSTATNVTAMQTAISASKTSGKVALLTKLFETEQISKHAVDHAMLDNYGEVSAMDDLQHPSPLFLTPNLLPVDDVPDLPAVSLPPSAMEERCEPQSPQSVHSKNSQLSAEQQRHLEDDSEYDTSDSDECTHTSMRHVTHTDDVEYATPPFHPVVRQQRRRSSAHPSDLHTQQPISDHPVSDVSDQPLSTTLAGSPYLVAAARAAAGLSPAPLTLQHESSAKPIVVAPAVSSSISVQSSAALSATTTRVQSALAALREAATRTPSPQRLLNQTTITPVATKVPITTGADVGTVSQQSSNGRWHAVTPPERRSLLPSFTLYQSRDSKSAAAARAAVMSLISVPQLRPSQRAVSPLRSATMDSNALSNRTKTPTTTMVTRVIAPISQQSQGQSTEHAHVPSLNLNFLQKQPRQPHRQVLLSRKSATAISAATCADTSCSDLDIPLPELLPVIEAEPQDTHMTDAVVVSSQRSYTDQEPSPCRQPNSEVPRVTTGFEDSRNNRAVMIGDVVQQRMFEVFRTRMLQGADLRQIFKERSVVEQWNDLRQSMFGDTPLPLTQTAEASTSTADQCVSPTELLPAVSSTVTATTVTANTVTANTVTANTVTANTTVPRTQQTGQRPQSEVAKSYGQLLQDHVHEALHRRAAMEHFKFVTVEQSDQQHLEEPAPLVPSQTHQHASNRSPRARCAGRTLSSSKHPFSRYDQHSTTQPRRKQAGERMGEPMGAVLGNDVAISKPVAQRRFTSAFQRCAAAVRKTKSYSEAGAI
eukprot:TRINITY_DN3129_c0_g3_i1.p1 TRINITY_DN3129_c0_g3~~TRINITY_DN3129_c0_g3_i1.p1  ORF type:complete len:939 (+),score=164.85 TRINITY_DN3129_c0_g3_i1:1076-3892(+)